MAKKHLIKVYIALWMLLLVSLGCYFLFFAPRDRAYSEAETAHWPGSLLLQRRMFSAANSVRRSKPTFWINFRGEIR